MKKQPTLFGGAVWQSAVAAGLCGGCAGGAGAGAGWWDGARRDAPRAG